MKQLITLALLTTASLSHANVTVDHFNGTVTVENYNTGTVRHSNVYGNGRNDTVTEHRVTPNYSVENRYDNNTGTSSTWSNQQVGEIKIQTNLDSLIQQYEY